MTIYKQPINHQCRVNSIAASHRHGFSLLEALLAVTVSSLLILLAASAIRSAGQTLRFIETTAKENNALFTSFFEALEDVDYWNSLANPDYPYLARPMSESVLVDGHTDHPYDKRPFAPVTFTPLSNPAALQPHEPRSWYRGAQMIMTMPVSRPPPDYEMHHLIVTVEDSITAYPRSLAGNRSNVLLLPAGWAPWHMIGDYAAMTRALFFEDGDADEEFFVEVAADDLFDLEGRPLRETSDYMPSLHWRLYAEMGHAGVMNYLPPGAVNIIMRPTTNRRVENIGRRDKLYDWGEVPWTFASGTEGATGPNHFSPQAFTFPSAGESFSGRVGDFRRRNLLPGMPATTHEDFAFVMGDQIERVVRTGHGNDRRPNTSNDRIGVVNAFAVCLETVASRSPSRFPRALFYPGRAFLLQDEWDSHTLIERTVEDPYRLLWDHDSALTSNATAAAQRSARMWRRFSHETRHQPSAATNDDRLPEMMADIIQAKHRIVRYRSNYNDRNRINLEVSNPVTGRNIELTFNTIGSTFRGARQHWGWKSSTRDDLEPMGDFYEP